MVQTSGFFEATVLCSFLFMVILPQDVWSVPVSENYPSRRKVGCSLSRAGKNGTADQHFRGEDMWSGEVRNGDGENEGQTRDRAVANELNRRSDNQPPSGDRLGDRSRESTSESTWYNGPSTTDSYSRGTRTRRQTTTESWEGTVESMNSRVCADGTVDAISGYRGERVVFKNEWMWRLGSDMREPFEIHRQFPELPEDVRKIDAAYENVITSTLVLISGQNFWEFFGSSLKASGTLEELGLPSDITHVDAASEWTVQGRQVVLFLSGGRQFLLDPETSQEKVDQAEIFAQLKMHPELRTMTAAFPSSLETPDELSLIRNQDVWILDKDLSLKHTREKLAQVVFNCDTFNNVDRRRVTTEQTEESTTNRRTVPTTERHRTARPTIYNRDRTTEPTIYNRDRRTRPTTDKRDETTAPTIYNRDRTTEPTMYNRDRTTEPTMYNRDRSTRPTLYNRDRTTELTYYNRDRTREPTTHRIREIVTAPITDRSTTERSSSNLHPNNAWICEENSIDAISSYMGVLLAFKSEFVWSLKDVGDMPEPSNIHVQFPELPQNVHKIDAAFQNKISSTLVLTSGRKFWQFSGRSLVKSGTLRDFGLPRNVTHIDAATEWMVEGFPSVLIFSGDDIFLVDQESEYQRPFPPEVLHKLKLLKLAPVTAAFVWNPEVLTIVKDQRDVWTLEDNLKFLNNSPEKVGQYLFNCGISPDNV
ncbi:hypothetical protein M8J77_019033 [Diaphorina citri]|nr:hypothetical protein M8J77_019033 [Diaphorina citri]